MTEYLKKFDTHVEYEQYLTGGTMVKPNVSYCSDSNNVHYNALSTINGHEYVDLGLPSGALWATMNVGASSETDSGLYFAWGETQGYTGLTQEKHFSFEQDDNDYKFTPNGIDDTDEINWGMSKYNVSDGKSTLELEDDAVNANWGGTWHLPTKEQYQELFDNTTYQYVSDYKGSNVSGILLTAQNGNTIFFPNYGYYEFNQRYNEGFSFCWTSSLDLEEVNGAYFFCSVTRPHTAPAMRCDGLSVRGIADKK